MASKTQIGNMALAHLGKGNQVANIETERSQEAISLRLFYDIALEATLRSAPWPFATKIQALALIEEDPNNEYSYSYRYPTDCVDLRRILSGARNDSRQSRVVYKIGQDNAGKVIWTDQEAAEFEYTARADDPSLYPPDFILALSYKLGELSAPALTAGDPFNLAEGCLMKFRLAISEAKANAFNEEQRDEEVESEFIRARG